MKLVIIPTYNEGGNISRLLAAVFALDPSLHILIVDDNSPDGTGKLVAGLADSSYPGRLFLLSRPGKLGLGSAYVSGFKWALARDYQYIVQMDADFSHNPKYIPALLASAADHDLVIGSRYTKGGGVANWSLLRRLISLGGGLYSRIILDLPVRDLTGGFKCFRREALASIALDAVRSSGYSFQIEMTYRVCLHGFSVREVPIVFEERNAGRSKMSGAIFREAIIMVPRLRAAKSRLLAEKVSPMLSSEGAWDTCPDSHPPRPQSS